jgi:hypothetical protein
MGLYPKPFIDKMDPAIKKLVAQVRVASAAAQVIPAANPMQMPAGDQGMNQMPSAMPQGEQMPVGHSGTESSTAPNAAPAVNPHDAK